MGFSTPPNGPSLSLDPFASVFGPENGTSYRLSASVAAAFPGRSVIEIGDVFDLEEYAGAGGCEAIRQATPHPEVFTTWRRKYGLVPTVKVGVFDVRWERQTLVVAHATWPEGYRTRERSFVVSEDRSLAERFATAVAEFCNQPRETVLAFRGGCWRKDADIYRAIQSASFEDLVLAGTMAREIQDDFVNFMSSADEYARYGVPWKRGVLFLGPPGNGKTHCLRATIRMLGVPCLYVQSLKARYETDDANIAAVFDRAREVTPCCLVFEDLDAMITDENRSTFLNQLDGFANASGMLTLATTNHPEKLDPAILDRPSRFDRKYHFAMPEAAERNRYIASWRGRLDPSMRITDDEVERLTRDTDGFSFAYLKELFLSAMIRWIRTRAAGQMFPVLLSQLATLREQMRTDPAPTPAPRGDAEPLLPEGF
jgi:AAA+ superfamily predicted ATPase